LPTDPIAIIGSGAWGSALGLHLARQGQQVRQWVREPELVTSVAKTRENPLFLPGFRLPENVRVTADPGEAVRGAPLVVAAVPSAHARSVYRELAGHLADDAALVVATKGIEEGTLALPLDVAREQLGDGRSVAALSGPSFATEVAAGRATAVVVASVDGELARTVQHRFASRTFRLYTNDDPIGVQLGGALKNVIAIAAGVSDALGMGLNTQAALVTRGLAEISRLGARLGGRRETFSGLAGLGDLVLTCTGELSRNRRVGQRLGTGESLRSILSDMRTVAEGVSTARSAFALARREGEPMPIVTEVHRMLYEERSPDEALESLMTRPLTSESPR
jgi:glycerol-3-phosphate dehydrogenase (NAD(P)+)